MELKSESAKVEDTQQVILLEQQKEEEEDDEKQKQQLQQSFHVLAVDDSVIDRKLLEKLLKVSSYQVTCVDSGDKALEFLGLIDKLDTPTDSTSSSPPQSLQQEGSKVNLIMTDFCMPGMSGYDLLKRVKGSSWKDVPVVVMSSENVPSRISMCLEEGAEEFLLKPLQLSDLEKLQPHLLKSLNMKSQTCTEREEELREDNNSNNNSSNNYINNSNSFSKRKALSAEPSERRPKMKELAVV
ncbi:two-component response regulator ORR9-like [Mangifera indica]|uniref:two-component response regulator ORR9-like n=1 Tax=Mangifera indica TaxID=29780 RepID=UPI001CFB233F|nr:two-component response regulator ORR9-like [Mangifera indica]